MAQKSSNDKSSVTSEPSNKQHRTLEVVQGALREVEEKCQAIINNIEDGYYEVDLDGNFSYFNDAMALITGYSRQELIGMNNRQIITNIIPIVRSLKFLKKSITPVWQPRQ